MLPENETIQKEKRKKYRRTKKHRKQTLKMYIQTNMINLLEENEKPDHNFYLLSNILHSVLKL